jgi:hypothetical protein
LRILEFAEAARYYAKISPSLGIRFYRETERLIADVSAHPDRHRMFDPPARRHISTDFPYALVYVETAEYLWIVAIMHLKRRPGYWRKRL